MAANCDIDSDQFSKYLEQQNRMCNDRRTSDKSATVCQEGADDTVDCGWAKKEESESIEEPDNEPKLALLDPDNPLLRKFQQNLKAHLLREKYQIGLDISDLKMALKEQNRQREDLGVSLYDMQAEMDHQNELMENHAEDIKKNAEERAREEEEVDILKCELSKAMCINKETKNMYNKKTLELENMQTLEARVRKWTEQFEDEVKNAKRIVSRDVQLQKQISEEKRKTDMLFYHLDVEINKKEKELRALQDESADMKEMIKELNNSVACANTDLECLQNEQKRLTVAWNEVIVAVQYRDKILTQLNNQFNKEKEEMKLCKASIESILKQISKENDQNAKLSSFRSRLMDDCAILKVQCAKEAATLKELLDKAETFPALTEQLEKDLAEATKEGHHIDTELRRIQLKVDKQNLIKSQFEERILKFAQDQLISDKASEHRMKLLNKMQDQRRAMELTMVQTQNSLSLVLLDIERLKGVMDKLKEDHKVIAEKLKVKDTKCDEITNEMKNLEIQMEIKMKKMEKLNKQLDDLNKAGSENVGKSATDIKMKQSERAITTLQQQITEHQQFWILLQNHYVNLTQKRATQLNEIQVTQKQLSIIRQKSYKIDQDLETSESKCRELQNDIIKYTKKLSFLNEKCFNKRLEHETEETNCEMEHGDLMEKLRANEMMVLGLEADIDEVQNDINHYKDLVLDKHHEALSWETKFKLIDETLRWFKDENANESEMGQMKSEIHRMQIRYNHLKKAQEKLIQDLDLCIIHRENIFDASNMKNVVKQKNLRKQAASHIQQKVNDMHNKIKQIKNEIRKVEANDIAKLKNERDNLYRDVTLIENQIQQEGEQIKQICGQIEEEKLRKYFNLEQIVRKQTRAKYYRQLVSSRTPPKISKSEMSIDMDTQKQMEINENMLDLLQTLAGEFPRIDHWFNKISQVLKD